MAQTRKRGIILINANDRYFDSPSIYSGKTSSLEDSYITIQSSINDSFTSDSQELRRGHRYIKHSKLNRNDDHVTSLKRRVRKQQLTNDQNQRISSPLSSTIDLYSLAYSQQPMISPQYQSKKPSCVVPLPPLIPNARVVRTRVRGIKLNMYGY